MIQKMVLDYVVWTGIAKTGCLESSLVTLYTVMRELRSVTLLTEQYVSILARL